MQHPRDDDYDNDPASSVLFSIYDMAGQPVYYDLLHLLLSRCVPPLHTTACIDLHDDSPC